MMCMMHMLLRLGVAGIGWTAAATAVGWHAVGVTLQHRMVTDAGEDEALFVVVLAEDLVFAQVETIADAETEWYAIKERV